MFDNKARAAGVAINRTVKALLMMVIVTLLPVTVVVAHTPYGQWDAFRLRHLQLLTTRTDLTGDKLADAWVAVLAEHLPKARAMVSRARDTTRLASLLKTDQAKLAVLSNEQADALFNARSPFEDFAPMPLQVLMVQGDYVLLARDDLPLEHGYLLVITLLEEAGKLQLSVPMEGKFGMALHPGARAAALGEKIESTQ